MRKCVTHTNWIPMPKVKVTVRSEVKLCLSNNSKTTEANLTQLHRKIENNEQVFRTLSNNSKTTEANLTNLQKDRP